MSDAASIPFEETVLRLELGSPRSWWRMASNPRRSRVWLVELQREAVVVKQVVGGADAADRYAREVAALRLAARVDPPVVPRLLATDPAECVLVLEHVGDSCPSREWLVEYAVALARLHAATGRADVGTLPAWSAPTSRDVEAFLAFASILGTRVPAGASEELADLVDRLNHMPGQALLHGDPCPGNDLYTTRGVRFVDLEQAALGNGLVELAYLRIGFPTCAFVTAPAPALVEKAEAAYRATWRAVTGTEKAADITDVCAGWLIRGDALVAKAEREGMDHLGRTVKQDWEWGSATARERMKYRLGVIAGLTANRHELALVGRMCTDLRRRMLERWPGLQSLPSRRPYITWV